MRRLMMATAMAGLVAAPVAAADLVPVVLGAGATGQRTLLEGVRETYSRLGRDVVVTVNGMAVQTIEWRHPAELRVRTYDGLPLTEGERQAVRAAARECTRGEPRAVSERTEPNGTFAVRYDCVWLQGFEPAWRALLPQ